MQKFRERDQTLAETQIPIHSRKPHYIPEKQDRVRPGQESIARVNVELARGQPSTTLGDIPRSEHHRALA